MSNFAFLAAEWPGVYEATVRAENAVHSDPRTACFYARRALELAVHWAYKHDPALKLPYQDNLSALIHDPSFKTAAGDAVFSKARLITKLGNHAVHSHQPIKQYDALVAVRELFHVSYWLAHTYARGDRPPLGTAFDPALLPQTGPGAKQSTEQLQQLQAQLHERDENLTALLADRNALDEELKRLRAEVAEAKKAASAQPDTHDYSEAETRDYFIDLLLKEAGWAIDPKRDCEVQVAGMPNEPGIGFVDYVLWGDEGKPLASLEAKRTRRDPRAGQQQAKLYADCLEQQFGQRPVIFYSNGYEHWLWDDTRYPPRPVQGFYKKAELELMIQRRTSRKPLSKAEINSEIVERYYQTRAIRRVAESFEQDHDRKALLVMATGAGKTRTVIALADLLLRCNWAKRVLFLADRVALVNQATNAFKQHLPDSSPVNLVTERDTDGRVFVSTYPTMMGLIDETRGGERRFGVGHFDLIVIDEAHRSVFQKYRAIFEYFDALLVGLTATPKDEVDRNTYTLFDLEDGVPTDAYTLEEAVADGYLVPPLAVSVPLRFQSQGIRYDELSEEDREQWDALEWDEEGDVPDRVEAEAVNKWLFNIDYGGQGPRARDDPRACRSGRRSAGQDNHLRPESRPRPVHRRSLRSQLPAPPGQLRPCHHLQDRIRSEPDRHVLTPRQSAPHRHLRRYARHRHRRARGGESGVLQAGALQDQVLADGRARHTTASRPVRPRARQAALLHLRLLRESGVLQPGSSYDGGSGGRVAQHPALPRTSRVDLRARS
jgi:type I restriction enzyme R subunit